MRIVVKNGKVIATHRNDQDLSGKYPGSTFLIIDDSTIKPGDDDPRLTMESRDATIVKNEILILEEIKRLTRAQAIQNLTSRGEI